MGRYTKKIIAAVVVVIALAGAWFMGGGGGVPSPVSAPGEVVETASVIYGQEPEDASIPEDALVTENTLIPGDAQIIEDGVFTVTLTVRADMLLGNMHLLNREMHELVPDDGIIFHMGDIPVQEGESVFDILQREMREAGIHMSARFTPAYGSAYIESINNLFEFDAGPLSGWMYSVNGEFPSFGSTQYILSPGDVIEWHYTLDLGWDIRAYEAVVG